MLGTKHHVHKATSVFLLPFGAKTLTGEATKTFTCQPFRPKCNIFPKGHILRMSRSGVHRVSLRALPQRRRSRFPRSRHEANTLQLASLCLLCFKDTGMMNQEGFFSVALMSL